MSAIPKVQLKANSQLVNFNVNTKLNSEIKVINGVETCLLYTSPSPRD